MGENKNFIRAEEVCTKLNQEIGAAVFTYTKFIKMVQKGLIKYHDVRTPGTKQPRYAFVYDEVKESLEKLNVSSDDNPT